MSAYNPNNIPHRNRELEWACALVLGAWAFALLTPGNTFSRPTMLPFANLATETTWGVVAMAISLVRMLGLWINGSWHRSPTLRFLTAGVGASVWAFMAWVFGHDGYPGMPTGEAVCSMLCCLDVFSALRSVRDQAWNDKRAAILRRNTDTGRTA